MAFLNLNEWLAWLEQLHPKKIDLGLERIQQVAHRLKLNHPGCTVVTIAGTNGKASCIALLESILLAAGYRVGTYTSPHLLTYNERIKINAKPVTDETICQAFAATDRMRDNVSLSYFEFTTLAALYIFQQQALDILLLEIGLGGRLDAVNIIDADIAVITTIDIDHVDWLGNDRESIGFEKAGIFRTGKPAVVGDVQVPNSVCQYAAMIGAKLYVSGRDFNYQLLQEDSWAWHSHESHITDLPIPPMHMQNAACALMVAELLAIDFAILLIDIINGIKNVNLVGRYHVLETPKRTILDIAHNVQACKYLAQKLRTEPCSGRTIAVVGMLEDKDHQACLAAICDVVSSWHVSSLDVLRGANHVLLTGILETLGVKHYQAYEQVEAAYHAAVAEADVSDRIIVFGSFHTVEKVLRMREGK